MDTLTLFSFCLSPLLIALCGRAIWFYGYAARAAIQERVEGGIAQSDPAVHSTFYPKLTVLKLLQKGETSASLHSLCQQSYPHYQIVFAVEASETAAAQVASVQKLSQQFPEREIQCITYPAQPGVSTRVMGLSHALKVAKFNFWVFADDVQMPPDYLPPDYLERLIQPFRYPSVGAVHDFYPPQAKNWTARWQALALASEFYPEMLVTRHQAGVYFVLPSVVAIRKAAVTQLGGPEAIIHDLAAGASLGYRLASIGYRVALCDRRNEVSHIRPIEATGALPAGSVWTTWQQQLNQARLIRRLQPWKYAVKGTTYGTIASLLLLWLWQGAGPAWVLVILTGLSRLGMAGLVGRTCLKDPTIWHSGWLLPCYDLISFVIWCLGWFGAATQRSSLPIQPLPQPQFNPVKASETEFLELLVQPAKAKGT